MRDWAEDLIERVEDVVYLAVAVVLVAIALVVLGYAVVRFGSLDSSGTLPVALDVLDALLLVFIVVELLYAVRTTLAERELVAEPFLLVGIIASIKEIVVLSAKAPSLVGTERLTGTLWLIGALTAAVGVLAVSSLLLRRKEREPTEGDEVADEGAKSKREKRQR